MASPKIDSWFLGVDLGTGSCKTVVVDQNASPLGFGEGNYPATSTGEKWEEQDPKSILSGMVESVHAALNQAGDLPGNCAGLSIDGALHSLMALDRSGDPLTGVITWADNRAAPQASAIRKDLKAPNIYKQTGCPVHGMYPLYKILWLREEHPEIFQQAARFVSAKEYVFAQLTGQFTVDYCLAAGTALLNTHTLDWNPTSLDLAGITSQQLSSLGDPREVFRGLKPELAGLMGISPSTPVVLGSSDAVNSNLGAGAVSPQQATCMIGTSGALRFIAKRPILDEKARSWCYAIDRDHWLVGGAISNGGLALSWLRDSLNRIFPDLHPEKRLSFEDLLQFAGQVGPGSGGLVCLPFLAGERSPHWNPNARAAFFGMSLQHDFRHLARALLEGVAYRFRSLYEVLLETGEDIRQIRASGGFTKSPLWLQIVTSALNRELRVPTWGETSCLGAAFWAMLGSGALTSLEEISEWVPVGSRYHPIPEEVTIYEKLYPLYCELYDQMAPVFDQLAGIQVE